MLYFTHLPRNFQCIYFYQIWYRRSPRQRNQLCWIFVDRSRCIDFLGGGVEICLSPSELNVAVNTDCDVKFSALLWSGVNLTVGPAGVDVNCPAAVTVNSPASVDFQDCVDPPSWKSWNRHISFSTKNHPIWIEFGTQMRTAAILKIVFGHNLSADCLWNFAQRSRTTYGDKGHMT